MNKAFWKGKKVLVVGHTGFKGSWLSLWLQRLNADVLGYALPPPTEPSLFDLAHVADRMTCVTGDIRDLEHLKAVVAGHRPEILIHMAAQSLVHHSYDFPVETYATNVMGTVNVLEAVRQSESVRVVVSVTSDKCYENSGRLTGYDEGARMGGRDPYSSSKGCAELVISAYRNSYFPIEGLGQQRVAVASARAGNVIGGGDWARDRLVPDIMNALTENRPAVIRIPSAVRPWQFVLDPLNAYLILAERLWTQGPEFAQGWNFGPEGDDVTPVSWIAERLTTLWGDGARWELASAHHSREDTYLTLDCSKAGTLLGWAPKLPLSTALEWIVQWYRTYKENGELSHLTETQIMCYEKIERQDALQEDKTEGCINHSDRTSKR